MARFSFVMMRKGGGRGEGSSLSLILMLLVPGKTASSTPTPTVSKGGTRKIKAMNQISFVVASPANPNERPGLESETKEDDKMQGFSFFACPSKRDPAEYTRQYLFSCT